MAGRDALAILPTGTGKSLCYQLPALSRYYKTGALTVVISPLVALMADQVAGLERQGITSCVTVNGLLSVPERVQALDKIPLGRCSDRADFPGATAEPVGAQCAVPTRDRLVGARRGPLPVQMGA